MLELGAGGYVGKPFLPGDLGGEMTKLLAGDAYESH
jgi:hypothetical protein